ncbi:MAG: DUF1552 domain-containing protein [Mariniblastus sp.]
MQRRTFLKAAGVSLSLPFLESMTSAWAMSAGEAPKRMVFVCTALGLHPPNLWPDSPGADYEMTPYLELLKDHRKDFTLFSGLQHEDQAGRQPHDSEMTWLTSARKPGRGGFRNTISIDQLAAKQFGSQTRFKSVTLGSARQQSQSYTEGGVMIPAEISPANLFAQLFLKGKAADVKKQRQRLNDGKSILDELGSQAKLLKRKASAADNHLLNDYFDSVRQAETNIGTVQDWMNKPKPNVDVEQPTDILDRADIIGRAKLLMDLVPLIVQTDSSRVVTVMIQDHFVVPKINGVTNDHHNLSHHGQDDAKIAQLQKIEREIVQCFGDLLGQMKSKTESGASLLDSTSVLFGSNLGNANAHHMNNLPIFLAGGGFNHGRYIKQKKDTPLCNLFVSMLNQAGIEEDSFGQSNGTLSW